MFRSGLTALFALILTVGASLGQSSSPAAHPPVPPSWPLRPGESPPANNGAPLDSIERMRREAIKQANEKRQKQVVSDTDKLLQLATELKEEIGKMNADTLSAQTIKKTQEIEKLARNVRKNLMPVTQ